MPFFPYRKASVTFGAYGPRSFFGGDGTDGMEGWLVVPVLEVTTMLLGEAISA